MNKQQLLDKENPSTKEWVIQQLLIANSRTTLGEYHRMLKRVLQAVYRTIGRQLTFESICECMEIATKLQNGESIENKEINISTEKPEGPKK